MTQASLQRKIERPVPIYISSRVRVALIASVVLALVLVSLAAPIAPTILLLGVLLALVLSFPLRPLSRVMPRGRAVGVVVLGTALLLSLLGVIVVPRVLGDLPGYAATLTAYQAAAPAVPVAGEVEPLLTWLLRALAAVSRNAVQDILAGALAAFSGVIGMLFYGFSLLVVTTYLLSDTRRFKATYLRAVPAWRRRDASQLWQTLGVTLTRILGAALVSNTVQGLLAFVFLSLIGVPYAPLLGAVMWVTAFVPIFGAWIGGIPAFLVALTVSPEAAVLTAVAYFVINLLDGNVLTPRLQGHALSLHPILILLAVLAAGQTLGLVGVLFTLPVLAVLRVVGGFFAERLRTPAALAPGGSDELAPMHVHAR